jgi:hypothetical protein
MTAEVGYNIIDKSPIKNYFTIMTAVFVPRSGLSMSYRNDGGICIASDYFVPSYILALLGV